MYYENYLQDIPMYSNYHIDTLSGCTKVTMWLGSQLDNVHIYGEFYVCVIPRIHNSQEEYQTAMYAVKNEPVKSCLEELSPFCDW